MQTKTTASKQKFTTKEIVLCGMFAALLAVISQISVPMPNGVPVTIQVFGVALAGAVLGWKLGLVTTMVYILLGIAGLPVFSGFRGGIQVLTGMAGGYVMAWPVLAVLCGIRVHSFSPKKDLIFSLILGIMGLAVVEIAGGLQWAYLSGDKSLSFILAYSMTAFVPKDIVLTICGILMGRRILKRNI